MKLTSKKKDVAKALLMATAIAGILAPSVASASVTLKSSDGSINLTGDLVEFTDEFYTLRTTLGDLRVSAERVRCEGADCPSFETAESDFTIAGSDTVGLGLMPLLMQGYASYLDADASVIAPEREGEVLASWVGDGGFGDDLDSYLVTSTTSGDAFKTLLDKSADIGMASRRIKPAEARALKETGAGNMVAPGQEHIVAVDGLVMVTHPSNPVSAISMAQVRGIYSGEITNWNQLGGANQPINFINRQDGSGTRSVFESRMFGGQEVVQNANFEIAEDNSAMSTMVTEDPNALGYVGFAFQRGAKPMSIINECGIETTPTSFSAKTEEYPLQRRLYLYNRADVSEGVNDFLDYSISSDADGVVRKSGFIDLGIETASMDLESARGHTLVNSDLDAYEAQFAAQMMNEMVNHQRLSTTFRFRTGSSRLDERGRLDMARLATYIENQPEGTEITLVGFTDDVGAFDANRTLSEGRAAEVANQLRNLAPGAVSRVSIKTMGFGEVSPSACNVSDSGRSINRRVEVWVRNQALSNS